MILAENEYNLQTMLNDIVKVCKTFGMELNEKKTTATVIEKKPETDITIRINKKLVSK